jgi:hypothetical protein
MLSNIKIQSLTGGAIKTYLSSIVQIRSQVLRDLPFLRCNTPEEDLRYLQGMCQHKEAIAVLVFDGPHVVGVSLGLPLDVERPFIKTALLEKKEEISSYFHFGISTLLPAYRGRGLAHHFFDIREEHVMHLKRFKKICFLEPIIPYPSDSFIPLDVFWKKRAYVKHKEFVCKLKNISLIYWIKEIVPIASHVEKEVEALLNRV